MDERDLSITEATDMLNMVEVINQMGCIKRFSRDHLLKDENVLEHVGFVVTFCAIIAERLTQQGIMVNRGRLLTGAAFHDIEENLTGDVARPTKYATKAVYNGLNSYANKSATHVFKTLGMPIAKEYWAEAKAEGIEGAILKMADFASVVVKCLTEIVYYGNRSFVRVLNEMLDSSTAVYQELSSKYIELEPYVRGLIDILAHIESDLKHNRNTFPINSWIESFEG